jgi:hypothetical protein
MRPKVWALLPEQGPYVRLISLTSRQQANRLLDRVRRQNQPTA